jgi:septal ring factor EnvC (AmiA/AmiB activator)
MPDFSRPRAARSPLPRPVRALLAVAAVAATATLGAPPASAQTVATASSAATSSDASAASLRADADAIATRYFAALTQVHELDDQISQNEAVVADLEARAARARAAARDRAVVAYQQSGSRLAAMIDGADVLDAARRVRIINQVNQHDQNTFTRLEKVSHDLQQQRHTLEATRAAHDDALATLKTQAAAIDAKLAEAAHREDAQRAATAAATAATSTNAAGSTPSNAAAAPTTPTTGPPSTTLPPAPTPPPDYSGTAGTHPHHDDPFLACVRQRESGGYYGAVSSSGAYRGAYQFAQSTWNATANHARRTELIGVLPNVASPYDQDDMAWTLYQWQGAGPWGGGCG